jgi:NAD(P)-dependent dehydrogenase (short-subunit alcohol dehydrogenase family)
MPYQLGMIRLVQRDRWGESMTVLDLFQLHGKVAVVTGASSGLGVAAARALAEAGADIALGARCRRVDRLADTSKLVEAAERRPLAVQTDVSRPEDCRRLIDQTVETLGRVDILVNKRWRGRRRPRVPEDARAVPVHSGD